MPLPVGAGPFYEPSWRALNEMPMTQFREQLIRCRLGMSETAIFSAKRIFNGLETRVTIRVLRSINKEDRT